MAAPRVMLVFSMLCFLFTSVSALPQPNASLCIETEKQVLLNFKQALSDPGKRLSSWSAEVDCCKWSGVYCHNFTGRVLQLDLRSPCAATEEACKLGGKVSPALLQLEFLNYLDLRFNDFGGTPIPNFLGSMRSLTHLYLSYASFGGLIPPQLGNLSNLQTLSLGGSSLSSDEPPPPPLYVENLKWISHLSSLQFLSMGGVDLRRAVDWLESINMLFSLSGLWLRNCNLDNINPSLQFVNFTSLTVLDLSENHFNHEMPTWLCKLQYSDSLYFSNSQLRGQIPECLGQLNHLGRLILEFNSLDGSVPSSIGNLSSLIVLSLRGNRLNGTLPSSLGLLSNLEVLEIGNYSFSYIMPEVHFANLSKLWGLSMFFSPSLIFKVESNWVPPFQLEELWMNYCQIGPKFPTWLQNQTSLRFLDFSNSGIVDSAPSWFWPWASYIDVVLYINDNQISGNLSGVVLNNIFIDLSSNCFEGELPRLSPNVAQLKMGNNSFSGPVSPFLCQKLNGKNNVQVLDMSRNRLSGELPNCWTTWPSLTHLNLGNNDLSGNIPNSMASLSGLQALQLHNNNLYGDIPPSLRNCTSLALLNLGGNKFSGNIPSWIGEFATLMVLSLKSNGLIGMIPQQICRLFALTVLDFSNNKLSGAIPKCFNNFSLMATSSTEDDAFSALRYQWYVQNFENLMLVTKGRELEYDSILKLVRIIDLSRNNLWGSIPHEISDLSGLQSLNLSFNHLMGNIPKNIGSMKSLESLDFSRNDLSGEIPQSIMKLTFLNYLNLSYNNFSGRIPSSTQLQSFDALSYIGNAELCGAPLTNCTSNEEPKSTSAINENEGPEIPWFFIGMGLGFIVGFWGVCGALLLRPSWRYAYFQFLYDAKGRISMVVAIMLNKLHNN